MTRTLLLLLAGLFVGVQSASAFPLSTPAGSDQLLLRIGATDCKGPIASEARPIFGTKLLARMRRTGQLPDTFVCGGCTYNLGGDPGAAYYDKTCR
jgi:hypothetical protein